jgi:hypothetical protein
MLFAVEMPLFIKWHKTITDITKIHCYYYKYNYIFIIKNLRINCFHFKKKLRIQPTPFHE